MTTAPPALARPPIALRIFIGLIGLGALMFNVALMISDQAPGVTRQLFGDFAQRLADRLDASDSVDTDRLPGSDALVHIGVWAVATMLVALTVWHWWALVPIAVSVFAASVVVEIGQGRYSSTRAVEVGDVLANAVGIALGTSAAAVCMLGWSAISRLVRETRRRHR